MVRSEMILGEKRIVVCNDTHANEDLLKWVDSFTWEIGDIVVFAGDNAGSRAAIGNELVRIYYRVKKSLAPKLELDDFVSKTLRLKVVLPNEVVFGSIHSGTFQKWLAEKFKGWAKIIEEETKENLKGLQKATSFLKNKGVKVYVLTGNGEILINDFDISGGVDKEVVVPPYERYLNQLALKGVFFDTGSYFVNYPLVLEGGTLLLPLEFIDLWIEGNAEIKFDTSKIKRIISHYPGYDEVMMGVFDEYFKGYNESKVGIARMKAVKEIASLCPNLKALYCGHIHKGTSGEDLALYTNPKQFETGGYLTIWNPPGNPYVIETYE